MFSNQQLKESIRFKNIINVEPLRVLVDGRIFENEEVNIGPKQKPDATFVIWENLMGQKKVNFSELDARIYSAIFTFLQYEVTEFSVEQLTGLIYGNFELKHRKEILLEVEKSIEQMSRYKIEIYARNQINKYPRLKGINSEFKGAFLELEIENGHARNGKETTIYRLQNPSPLMVYAQTMGYIVKIDMELYHEFPGYINYIKMAMCEDLLHRISLANYSKNSMYKNDKNILVFGWDKNKKRYAGIIGNHLDVLDERKIESMLKTLTQFWENLKKTGLISAFEIVVEDYNYETRHYKKIYIKRSKQKNADV